MSDVLAVVSNTPKTEVIKGTGFAKRSVLDERIAKEEKELEEMKSVQTAESAGEADEMNEEPTSAEERSFKKRYGDLRRHTQKLQLDMQKQIDDLKVQLEQSTKQQINLPKSEAELDAWVKEYPDVAKIVETIAIKKAQEQSKGLEERMQQINQMQADTLKEKAEAELMRLHPDFGDIREKDEFHEWVESQPKWVQQALYENETDAKSAARAIDLYKADMGISAKKATKKSEEREAASSVRTGKSASVDQAAEPGIIRESEVERMSAREYERRQEEIVAAVKAGKFIYDLSGAAR
jgi:hypothetical protein